MKATSRRKILARRDVRDAVMIVGNHNFWYCTVYISQYVEFAQTSLAATSTTTSSSGKVINCRRFSL